MPDQTIKCRDCGNPYQFSAEEQQLFASQGLFHPPSRCHSCREARAATHPQGFSNGAGGNGAFRREEPRLHPAVCARCGKATEVPFVPREDRPVYCRECYVPQRPRDPAGFRRRE